MNAYNYKYGQNRVPTILKIVMMLWYIGLIVNIYSMYNQYGELDTHILTISLISTMIFIYAFISVKRHNVFEYEDYFTYRGLLGSKDIYYEDVASVEYKLVAKGDRSIYHYVFYDEHGKRLTGVSTGMFANLDERRMFIRNIQIQNPNVHLGLDLLYLIGDVDKDGKLSHNDERRVIQGELIELLDDMPDIKPIINGLLGNLKGCLVIILVIMTVFVIGIVAIFLIFNTM